MKRTSKRLPLILALAAAAGIVGVITWRSQPQREQRQVGSARTDATDRWLKQDVAGVRLEAPGTFHDIKADFGPAMELIASSDAHQLNAFGLEVQVIRIVYKTGVELSLEDSVQGAIDGFAHLPGITKLVHEETPCLVSGRPALQVRLTAVRGDSPLGLRGLTILDDRTLYQIQALYEQGAEGASEHAQRVIASAAIAP